MLSLIKRESIFPHDLAQLLVFVCNGSNYEKAESYVKLLSFFGSFSFYWLIFIFCHPICAFSTSFSLFFVLSVLKCLPSAFRSVFFLHKLDSDLQARTPETKLIKHYFYLSRPQSEDYIHILTLHCIIV